MFRMYFILFIGVMGLWAQGCSHALRVTHKPSFAASFVPAQVLRIGVTSTQSMDEQESNYINAVVNALRANPGVELVVYPYKPNLQKVDVVVNVEVSPQYKGDWSNFFVSWPGYIVFAPAWAGYGYKAAIDTHVTVVTAGTNQVQQDFHVKSEFKCRESEIDRTWTQATSWLLDWGISSVIGGAYYTTYDNDITNDFIGKMSSSYGNDVARKILQSVQVPQS